MPERIVIINYKMGNLRSVMQALISVGSEPVMTSDPDIIKSASKLVLPGQGELGNAIREIDRMGLREILVERVNDGIPLLGICVGMQLLFESGEEAPNLHALGLIHGTVPRFPDGMKDKTNGIRLKVPQMGWNRVDILHSNIMTSDINNDAYFYFVHSFHCQPSDDRYIALRTTYGDIQYCSMAADETNGRKLFATQFHPEKSQRMGLKMLKRFVDL
jgi:imidazole glycerol-phosphate synthase subunit HisH